MTKNNFFAAPIFIIIFFVSPITLSADEETIYRVREIYFDITGRTDTSVILRKSEIKIGDEVKGETALREYIAQKTQALTNRRELQEVKIDFVLAEADDGGVVYVDITIHSVDTRNFIIVPEPRYSSDTGWEPSLRIRDYNFLGLMTPLRINLTYKYNNNDITFSRSNINALVGTDIPFNAFGFAWNFTTENVFSYYFGEPFSYNSINGLSLDVPLQNTALTFGFSEGLYFGKEYYEWEKYIYRKNMEDIRYMSSRIYAAWKIPVSAEIKGLGKLIYRPLVSMDINYALDGSDLARRNGPSIGAAHKFGFEKIDWIGNFRRGTNLYIENNNEYNLYFEQWDNSVTANTNVYFIWTDFLGMSARARFTKWFYGTDSISDNARSDNTRREVTSLVRGRMYDLINADSMLLFSFDFTFHVFNFMFSELFNDKRLKIIDFEFQAAPFIDIALIDGLVFDSKKNFIRDISFSANDCIAAAGTELFFFPLAFRSIFLRFSAGFNLNKSVSNGDGLDLYMGFGHHY